MSLIRVSEKKLAANRANARLSRGPSTPQGKERSSRNACKHHLYAKKYQIHPAWQARISDVVQPAAACAENPLERAHLVHYIVLKQWIRELDAYETRLLNQSIARHRSFNRGVHHFVTTNPLFHAIESRIHILHRQADRAYSDWQRTRRTASTSQTTPNLVEIKPLTMAAAAGSPAPLPSNESIKSMNAVEPRQIDPRQPQRPRKPAGRAKLFHLPSAVSPISLLRSYV